MALKLQRLSRAQSIWFSLPNSCYKTRAAQWFSWLIRTQMNQRTVLNSKEICLVSVLSVSPVSISINSLLWQQNTSFFLVILYRYLISEDITYINSIFLIYKQFKKLCNCKYTADYCSSSSLSHWNPYLQLWMTSSMWTPELEAQSKDTQDGFRLSLMNPWRMSTQLCFSKRKLQFLPPLPLHLSWNRLLHYTL